MYINKYYIQLIFSHSKSHFFFGAIKKFCLVYDRSVWAPVSVTIPQQHRRDKGELCVCAGREVVIIVMIHHYNYEIDFQLRSVEYNKKSEALAEHELRIHCEIFSLILKVYRECHLILMNSLELFSHS